jgi:GNAT superfamily N-acetyltransferase
MWEIYRHAKGQPYLGTGAGLHSETLESLQFYRCLYANTNGLHWARPYEMFHEESDGRPRFKLLGKLEVVAIEDIETLLHFGYDAWGEGRSPQEFIRSYEQSPNHLRGQRFGMRDTSGELVAGLNILRFSRRITGIASVVTKKDRRNQGFASLLLAAVMAVLEDQEGRSRFILFSETQPAFYQRLGFIPLGPEVQKFLPSVAMMRSPDGILPEETVFFEKYF